MINACVMRLELYTIGLIAIHVWYIWIKCFILPDELSVCVCSHVILAWGHATSSIGPFPMPVSCSALDLTYSSSCPLPLLTIKWNVVLYQCFACYVYDIVYFWKFVDSPAHPQLLILIQLIIFLFLFQIFLNKFFSFNYALWFNKKVCNNIKSISFSNWIKN